MPLCTGRVKEVVAAVVVVVVCVGGFAFACAVCVWVCVVQRERWRKEGGREGGREGGKHGTLTQENKSSTVMWGRAIMVHDNSNNNIIPTISIVCVYIHVYLHTYTHVSGSRRSTDQHGTDAKNWQMSVRNAAPFPRLGN